MEKIGNVILDDTYYPGEDLYCDGIIEDEILDIVKNEEVGSYRRIIEEKANWPILYHLSPLRENIVNWIPLDKSKKVLEVGSGCGAITGALAKRAGSVTCIDLSKKRSMINAYRHKEMDNITIHMGNFKDIEPTLPNDYDYIFLIGVFEYGQGYMGSDTPYEDFMNILKRHLNCEGRLVIAIENKFGLKYWAGCKEDHLGTYFEGIEDYPNGGGVRTFTRPGLEKICKATGVEEYSFYYPYPDYKFMTTVYSDKYLPKIGELSDNNRNFDRSRLQLFDEKNVFDGIVREECFPLFSNSYVLVIGKELEVCYSKFSNDRDSKYAIRTDICMDQSGNKWVEKAPLTEDANSHIEDIEASYEKLCKRFEGSKLVMNTCQRVEDKIAFSFVKGKTLEELFDSFIDNGNKEGFYQLLEEYIQNIDFGNEHEISDLDLIFSNILVEENKWHVIDYEWTFPKKIPTIEILTRALYCYSLGSKKRERFLKEDFINELNELGVTKERWKQIVESEMEFQKKVTGQRLSMGEIRNRIGHEIVDPYEEKKPITKYVPGKQVQIYEDLGAGFCEEQSYFMDQVYINEHEIHCEIEILPGRKGIRIDPSMEPCLINVKEFCVYPSGVKNATPRNILHGKSIFFSSTQKFLDTNGHPLAKNNYVFATEDPNITLHLTEEEKKSGAVALIKMDITPLPKEMAETLSK